MSVRKAQTDFFSPMTGNVFRDNRRRADLIMKAAKVDMIKTDDPFTQIAERKSYAPKDDPASISDAFDKEYGVLSDEEAATILEENKKKIEEPTPVIDPEPSPTPGSILGVDLKEVMEVAKNKSKQAVEKSTEVKKKGREAFMGNSKYKMKNRVANRNKAKAMAKARKASTSSGTSSSRSGTSSSRGSSTGRGGARGGSTGGRGASSKGGTGSGRSSQGRGGARGGSTGGSGASSKGGVSRGSRRGGVGRGGRRGGSRRCDIRCKFDISLLTNMNLVNDDLATLAYFVKDIKK